MTMESEPDSQVMILRTVIGNGMILRDSGAIMVVLMWVALGIIALESDVSETKSK